MTNGDKNLREALKKYYALKKKNPEELSHSEKLHIENMEYLAQWKGLQL